MTTKVLINEHLEIEEKAISDTNRGNIRGLIYMVFA